MRNVLTKVKRVVLRVPTVLTINEAERRKAGVRQVTAMVPCLLLIHSPPCRGEKGVIVKWGSKVFSLEKDNVCVGAASRSSQSCTVESALMTLLLMVFGRTNDITSSFC